MQRIFRCNLSQRILTATDYYVNKHMYSLSTCEVTNTSSHTHCNLNILSHINTLKVLFTFTYQCDQNIYTVIWEIFVLNSFVCKIFMLKYFHGSWQPTKIKCTKFY